MNNPPGLKMWLKLLQTLPHSNANEEQVFSLIIQNKTDLRSTLSIDGTLASTLTVRMASAKAFKKLLGSTEKCCKKQPFCSISFSHDVRIFDISVIFLLVN